MTGIRGLYLSSASIALLAAATPALAQTAPAETKKGPTTTEIVVTAQFRSQKLQDTPLAITAMNGASLAARGQTNIAEVAAQTPNVTLSPQNAYLGPGIIAFIRGVGQTDPNFALEPGVGMYIDDVYLPTLTGSLLDLMDLDRVEVLRGPQGTLAGRNSLGGSIKLYSVKPQGNGKGMVEGTYGAYNRIDLRAMFDMKLSDNLFLRVSGASKNRDGYVKRLDYAKTHPGSNVPTYAVGDSPVLGTLGGTSFAAGKVALRWLASSDVEVNVAADFTRQRDEPGPSILLYGNAIGQFAGSPVSKSPARPWLAGVNGASVPLNCAFVTSGVNSCDTTPAGYDGRYISYATFIDNAHADSQMPYKPLALNPHSNLDNYGLFASIDWTINDHTALKSISSYRQYDASWAFAEGAPVQPSMLEQAQSNKQYSEELRLTGKAFNNMLDYTVGGFYFHADGTYTGRIDLNYAGIDFLHGPDKTPATNKAVFANGSLHPTDALTLTGGIRASWDAKDYTYTRRNPDGSTIQACTGYPFTVGSPPNCAIAALNGLSAQFRKQRTDWRVAADYRFSPQLMTYAQISTGYRAGGVNPRPFFINQAQPFQPETIVAYELGFKSDLFDRKLRFNVSAFYNDYKNIILTTLNCPNSLGFPSAPCLQPKNVGSAHVKGFEVETTIRPVERLTLDGSLSYLDFKYTTVDSASTGVQASFVPPYTPAWKWNAGVQYEVPDVRKGTLILRADGSYQSHIYVDPTNVDRAVVSTTTATGGGGALATQVATNRIDGYFLANARLTWKSQEDGWSASFELRNLLNKYYFTSMTANYANVGTVSGAPGLPRTWAVTLKKDF
jgi:iron complex outermembrane receptor protein